MVYGLLEKCGGVGVDNDGSMGFEVVDGFSNGDGIVVEIGRGHSDEAQVRHMGFSNGFGGLDYRWSYNRVSMLVRWDLSIKVDDVDD